MLTDHANNPMFVRRTGRQRRGETLVVVTKTIVEGGERFSHYKNADAESASDVTHYCDVQRPGRVVGDVGGDDANRHHTDVPPGATQPKPHGGSPVTEIQRQTVDLSAHPDLIVIYLGMKVKSLRGLRYLMKVRRNIQGEMKTEPEGLLHSEWVYFSFLPPHFGIRQYWRDFDALETWARSSPHMGWWDDFVRNPKGTGFWHEAYAMGGGIDAVYDYVDEPIGLMECGPVVPAGGTLYSSRDRFEREGDPAVSAPVQEKELLDTDESADPDG